MLYNLDSMWPSVVVHEHSLQSQEILNRPVFVLDILKSVWKFWKLLKILKRFWKLLKILNRFWTLLKILNIAENSEQILKILNRFWKFWTDSEHYWKFWTLLKILTITENSEQILNIIFLLKSIYFISFSIDFYYIYRFTIL